MAENLGTGVSFVTDPTGYSYDTVVFQKGKPPLDTEFNEAQDIRRLLAARQTEGMPSGWMTLRPTYTSSLLENQFYTQNPSTAIPEYALVNGMVIYVTNTNTSETNSNLIDLGSPPLTGNVVQGAYLEVWRALLDPDTDDNRPDPETIIDALMSIYAYDTSNVWTVGENGLILHTENSGQSWAIQLINTKKQLNSVYFVSGTIGWVVGDGGVIGRSTSGGDRWNVLQSGYTENLNEVYAYSQLIAWIVGDTGLLLKTNNGVNWIAMTTDVTVNLNSVYFHDNLLGWAVGDTGTILRSTDGGSTWLVMNSRTTQNLNNVHFYDLNFGFAVGDNGTILRSSDGGLCWVNQSGNVYDGSYKSLSVNYSDVTMVPNLDEDVNGEDATSQFTGSNKNFTTMNVPITKGDGLGTTTNVPTDVTVTVAGVEVDVDSLNGTTGQIILHEAPRACDTVLVSYSYKISTEIFRGKAWITGASGTILKSDDIGAQWIEQDADTAYDLNGVAFVDQSIGWLAGDFSKIRYTENGGSLWTEQKSDVISRQVQRVFYEGNKDTVIFLSDESIHPDTNIETTKRVQVQYKIRVADGVDPLNYPEAGLGMSNVVGLGPNDTGNFAFENMGASTGDYGLWQAKCSNTVDGYCWAIPMYFVNRRNSSAYNPATNSNGSHTDSVVRPDLLTGANLSDRDILDVRRLINIPSVNELLDRNFDALMNNTLKTRFFRGTQGGDRYGTEILQLDRIGGIPTDGGEAIVSADLADAVAGNVDSTVEIGTEYDSLTATSNIPTERVIDITDGLSHPNVAFYSAYYESTNSAYNNKPLPGKFSGIGTNQVIFTFSVNTYTTDDDIQNYRFAIRKIVTNTKGLNRVPSDPKLVKNYDGQGSSPAFYYQGVFDNEVTGRILEQWDSGVPGYVSYSIVYPSSETTIPSQSVRASSVEVHSFVRLTSNMIVSTNQIKVDTNITVTGGVSTDVKYQTWTIKKINNIDSNFSYKIEDMSFVDSENKTYVTTATGFPFLEGVLIEVVYMVLTEADNLNFRNGASVNFIREAMKISLFSYSTILEKNVTTSVTSLTFTSADVKSGQTSISSGIILGISTTETVTALEQAFCWVDSGAGDVLTEVTVTNINTDEITLNFSSPIQNATVSFQGLILQSALLYGNDTGNDDGLLIGYNYIPYQSTASLPSTVTVKSIMDPKNLYMSSLGTGGSSYNRDPYEIPLNNIPVNDNIIQDDSSFYNIDLMRFADFSIDSGFIQLPIYIPGSLNEELTLSGIAEDNLSRFYYNTASKEFKYTAESLRIGLSRKIFIPVLCRIKEASDNKLLRGEYVLVIVSRHALMELDNYVGYEIGDNNIIAIYRLPNRPMAKV